MYIGISFISLTDENITLFHILERVHIQNWGMFMSVIKIMSSEFVVRARKVREEALAEFDRVIDAIAEKLPDAHRQKEDRRAVECIVSYTIVNKLQNQNEHKMTKAYITTYPAIDKDKIFKWYSDWRVQMFATIRGRFSLRAIDGSDRPFLDKNIQHHFGHDISSKSIYDVFEPAWERYKRTAVAAIAFNHTLIVPTFGAAFDPSIHETLPNGTAGANVTLVLFPGLMSPTGIIVYKAVVSCDAEYAMPQFLVKT